MNKTIDVDQFMNKTFNFLTVMDLSDITDKYNSTFWKCLCTCGKIVHVNEDDLRSERTKSCGCKVKYEKPLEDFTGKLIGSLRILERSPRIGERSTPYWICKCDICGKTRVISHLNLKYSKPTFCCKFKLNKNPNTSNIQNNKLTLDDLLVL